MLQTAFKEWAIICEALCAGVQILILRKGGIEEGPAGFQVKHQRFWLFPTYTHQHRSAITTSAQSLFDNVENNAPPADVIHLNHYATVHSIHRLADLDQVLSLQGLHIWSEEAVRQKFHYRAPGLYLLTLRVNRVPHAHPLTLTPEYEGCRSWVSLDEELSTANAVAVLSDSSFADACQEIIDRLEIP